MYVVYPHRLAGSRVAGVSGGGKAAGASLGTLPLVSWCLPGCGVGLRCGHGGDGSSGSGPPQAPNRHAAQAISLISGLLLTYLVHKALRCYPA